MAQLFGEAAAPTKIGRFRVERRLGEGAMGVVYAAVDDQLGRRVAIKLLHPHLAHDDLGRARLLREARAMARLEHENIVRIYEVSAWNDQVYLAMELIEGVTLDAWLRERARPWSEALAIFVQAGRALSAAHRAGFLHRDFKPENVLVDRRGRARVLDFGLARALEGARDDLAGDLLEPLTRTGSILGTPAYMAPEQLRSGEVDARSDQFSFCVALFEALHGARPFGQLSRFAPLPPIAPQSTRVPARVRRAIARGLAERPGERWPDMDALLAVLERPTRARPTWLVGAVAGALATGLCAAWWVRGGEPPAPAPAVVSAPPASSAPVVVDPQREAAARHERVIRARDAAAAMMPHDPTTAVLVLREIDAGGPAVARALAEPISVAVFTGHEGSVRAVRFDDAALETIDAAGVTRRFAVDGRGPAVVGEPASPVAPRRSPDGALELRDVGGRLGLAHAGGRVVRLSGATGPIGQVAWSPDGRQVAFSGPGGAVWLASRTGGRPRALARRGARVHALAWSSDGRRLAVGRDDGVLSAWHLSARRGREIALPVGLSGAATALALSADGRWLAAGADDGTVRVFSLDAPTVAAPVLRGHAGPITALAFDPTAVRIASGSDDGAARVWPTASRALAVRALPGPLNTVAWRPDGEVLAVGGDRGVGVWLLPAEGGEGRALAHPDTVYALAWSADGRELATADAAGVLRRWSPDADAPTHVEAPRRGPVLALAWAPGRHLASGGTDEAITLWPADAAAVRRLPLRRGTVGALAWSPAGDRLAAVTLDGALALTADGVPAVVREPDAGDALLDLAWSPTGDAVAVVGDRRTLVRVPAGADGEPVVLGRHPGVAWSVTWDPRGEVIATGAADGAVRVWPVGGGPPEVLHGHGEVVHALAFAPRGDVIASAGADGRLILWPRPGADLRERLRAATTACLSPVQRQELLGEPADAASAAAAACESAAGR